jgi:hypothetical protein
MSEEIKHEELDEVKASYGVNAEVPDPKTKKAKAPGGDGKAAGHDEAPTAVKPVKPAEVKVTKEDVDVSEDIAAIFGGQDLSEDFVSRATDIFEAAVVAKVNEVLESKQLDLDAELEATAEEMVEGLSDRLDQYLEYVAEEWMEENKLAVEQGIRAEIAENFLKGLHSLFQESYIDVPEEKADLVDELAAKLEEVHESMNHEIERSIALHEELVEMKKQIAFAGVIDGLAESQIVKLQSLAEGVEFESEEQYADKLETLKETYFPSEKALTEDVQSLDEDVLELDEETAVRVDPGMRSYLDAISRTAKK